MKLCECGCGLQAPISTRNHPKLGIKKGEPYRLIRGHKRHTTRDRAWVLARIREIDGCWVWTADHTRAGYGMVDVSRFGRPRLRILAHRLSYELFVGPIPDGLVLDHLCRNTRCVRPEHLEPVTSGENIRRGYAFKRATNERPATLRA